MADRGFIVVGAGIAGACVAERISRGLGRRVLVVDRADREGGLAADRVRADAGGMLVGDTAPFFLHTNSETVRDYLRPFADWIPHRRRVVGPDGDTRWPDGDSDTAVWKDAFQAVPRSGWTELVRTMLHHPLVELRLGTDFHSLPRAVVQAAEAVVWAAPLDALFRVRLPHLTFDRSEELSPDLPGFVLPACEQARGEGEARSDAIDHRWLPQNRRAPCSLVTRRAWRKAGAEEAGVRPDPAALDHFRALFKLDPGEVICVRTSVLPYERVDRAVEEALRCFDTRIAHAETSRSIAASHAMVVARYAEDVSWVGDAVRDSAWLSSALIVNKGETAVDASGFPDGVRVTAAPNVGREGGTYLRYIVDNYDSLPDHLWFVQGDPFEHSPDFLRLLDADRVALYDPEFQPLTMRYNDKIPPTDTAWDTRHNLKGARVIQYYIRSDTQQVVEAHEFADHAHAAKVSAVGARLGTDSVLAAMSRRAGVPAPGPIVPFCWSAVFYVAGRCVRRHPRKTYEELEAFLLECHPQGGFEGYMLERYWQYLFTLRSHDSPAEITLAAAPVDTDVFGSWSRPRKRLWIRRNAAGKAPTRCAGAVMFVPDHTGAWREVPGVSFEGAEDLASMPCATEHQARVMLDSFARRRGK